MSSTPRAQRAPPPCNEFSFPRPLLFFFPSSFFFSSCRFSFFFGRCLLSPPVFFHALHVHELSFSHLPPLPPLPFSLLLLLPNSCTPSPWLLSFSLSRFSSFLCFPFLHATPCHAPHLHALCSPALLPSFPSPPLLIPPNSWTPVDDLPCLLLLQALFPPC